MKHEAEHADVNLHQKVVGVPWFVDVEDEEIMRRRRFTANYLVNTKIDENFWLWDGYIPYRDISGLAGPADVGKSSLLRQLALEVIRRSKDFLGAKLNVRSGRVIYISTEDGIHATAAALKTMMKVHDVTKEQRDNLVFIFDVEDVEKEINSMLIDPHVDLIIVDCLGDVFSGNVNEQNSIRQYFKPIKALAERYECAVLFLHHNVKGSEKAVPDKNKMVGSQAIAGKMRSVMELRLGDMLNERLLSLIKGNYVSADAKSAATSLIFDRESLLFSRGNRKVQLSSLAANKASKFDKDVWLPRLKKTPDNIGIAKRIQMLEKMYPGETVPRKTWFVENRAIDEAEERRVDSPENDADFWEDPFVH